LTNIILAAGILFLAFWAIRWFARTPPATIVRAVKTVGGLGILGLAGLLFLRGRWDFAMGIGGIGLWLLGLGAPPNWAKGFRTAGKGSAPAVSRVRSAMLEMELDHDSGTVDGSVLAGAFEGSRLAQLSREDLSSLLRACRRDDPEGVRLLEAYLDRRFSDWRATDEGDGDSGRANSGRIGAMSEDEAYEVLGLHKDATRDEITRAHRALMKKIHPDHGGTTSLAARVNEAKDILMRRHR